MAGIDQHEGATQGLAARQILLEQFLPFGHDSHRGIGIAIARKIDQVMPAPDREEVDFLCAAGCIRCARQSFASCQGVDQAGFPNVGAACKTHFDPVGGRQAGHGDNTFEKLGLAREKKTPDFCRLCIRLFSEGEGKLLHHKTFAVSPIAILPEVMTSAWTQKS